MFNEYYDIIIRKNFPEFLNSLKTDSDPPPPNPLYIKQLYMHGLIAYIVV